MRALRLSTLVFGLCVGVSTAWGEPDWVWPQHWEGKLGADHPLVGRIWSAETKTYLSPEGLMSALAQSPLVLVGEVHDNVDHHRVQGAVLNAVSALRKGDRPDTPAIAAVFEHIRSNQADALAEFRELGRSARRLPTAHDLFKFLRWKESGWPNEDIFLPLYSAAVQGGIAILPGDVPRETIRVVAKQGPNSVAPEEQARLGLDAPLSRREEYALFTELEESHCGLLPKAVFANMAFAQRYRDARLADALLQGAAEHGGAILFAGNGHVRADRGVPWYLRRRVPDMAAVTVMVLEVEDGKTDPDAYVPREADGRPAADYVVFTPRAERPDPCEKMREHMEKK